MKCFDPYDIWALSSLGELKSEWTQGRTRSSFFIPLIGIAEIFAPTQLRKLLGVTPHSFAHIEALLYLTGKITAYEALSIFRSSALKESAWGLPFSWYSKNGIYPANTPYITNTPYVMEALIVISSEPELKQDAESLFNRTWDFLGSLHIMHATDTELALSYSPIKEPRIVVNANSYAALAYALHASFGDEKHRYVAEQCTNRIVGWLTSQQKENGSWLYYADNAPGNFIDCFHSCFAVKNLHKVARLLPSLENSVRPVIQCGWRYIQSNLYDSRSGLCQRFSLRSHKDLFRWDLYDQAEYLGLLIDFGLIEEARSFSSHVESCFYLNGDWYCRIDLFGRRWGKNFMRWGIVPYLYQKHRLQQLILEHY